MFFLRNKVWAFWFVQWNIIVKFSSCVNKVFWVPTLLHDNSCISLTSSLPLLLILVFHIQHFLTYHHAVIHISPCELIKEQSFCLAGSLLYFVVLSCVHGWKGPEGERQCCLLKLISLRDTEVSGTGSEERIFYLTLSVSVETSRRLRPLWHTWWSAALHMIMTALLHLPKSKVELKGVEYVCVTIKKNVLLRVVLLSSSFKL